MSYKENFKQAVNDLMKGKLSTDEPAAEQDTFAVEGDLIANAKSVVTPTQAIQLPPTTISKGTVILGEVRSECDVNLAGEVRGSIHSTGNVLISGKVTGNVNASDLKIKAGSIQGHVVASGNVVIDENSVVIGDVTAANLQLFGKIKGNVLSSADVNLHTNSILIGDITAQSISMNQARVKGKINITLPEEEIDIQE
jgi:cytoskeletal protein CcmA (bactofilin family)